MKVLYVSATGTADPTRTSIPFHIAVNGSVEAGQEALIALAGDAAELLLGDALETLEGVGVPPMRELVAKVKEHELPVYV